jgi:hypothetical protein
MTDALLIVGGLVALIVGAEVLVRPRPTWRRGSGSAR